ncbi:Peptidyl-prolyl isomerase cwc27 [Sparganum proliferum]
MAVDMRLKRVGARTQPCFTPLVTANASVVRDSRHHAIVELTHHLNYSVRTAEFLHDFLQAVAINRVEEFRQLREGRVEVGPHLLTVFLQLTGGKDHASGSTMTAAAALSFRQGALFQVVVQTVEKDASEDLSGDVQQRNVLAVDADLVVTIPLVEVDDCGVLEILRDLFLTPHLLEERRQMVHGLGASTLANLSADRFRSGRFPAGELLHDSDGFVDS